MNNEQNFKKWFAKSVVTDEHGGPLVVYHGTNKKFDVFDTGKIGGANGRMEGAGFYFTTDKNVGKAYTGNDGLGHLFEAYLRIQKPIKYDQKGFNRAQISKILTKLSQIESEEDGMEIADGFLSNFGYIPQEGMNKVMGKAIEAVLYDNKAHDQLGGMIGFGTSAHQVNRAVYEALGYDGYVSNGYTNSGGNGGVIWVAMFPWQIKSIENKGSWNLKSDNIMENKMDEAFKEFKVSTFKKIGQLFGKPLTTQSAEWSGQATWKVSKEVFLHVDDNWNLILVKRKTTEHDEYEDTDISEVSLEDMDNGSVDKLIKSAKELATSNIAESLAFDGDLL